MLAVLFWWLVVTIIGVVATPITLRLLRNLPDRGYAFAKPVGLLMTGYLFWLAVSLGFLRNSAVAILFVMGLVGLASFYLLRRGEVDIRAFWRGHRATIITTEVIFFISLGLFSLFRAYNPEITATEKPMEFAFLNAILRSETFPPHDPWLSGYAISYYYFGYLMMAMLTKLTGLLPEVTYNLTQALLFAMTVTGAFGLVSNMVALHDRRSAPQSGEGGRRDTLAVPYGVLGSLFVAVIGNLEAVFEFLHANGWGSESFWRWLDIKNLMNAPLSNTWYPTDMWWWWRASRVIHDRNPLGQSVEVIDEFPFFSFLLGDVHPHVLALPFVLVALALALNILAARGRARDVEEGAAGFLPSVPYLDLLAWGVLFGGLGFLNTWDFPIYLGVFLLAYAIHRYWQGGGLSWSWFWDVLTVAVTIFVLGILLYLPFYVGFRSQAGGPRLVLFYKTRLHQYLIMFGLFIYVVCSLLLAFCGRSLKRVVRRWWFWIILGFSFLLMVGFAFLHWWLVFLLTGMLGVAIIILLELVSSDGLRMELGDREQRSGSAVLTFALISIFVGLLLTFSVEFVYLKDTFGTRMNTVFKFYYQAWVLLAIASAFAAYWILHGSRVGREVQGSGLMKRGGLLAMGRGIWIAGFMVLFAASLLYPVAATYSKANGFKGKPTLNGMAYLARHNKADYEAIMWLRQNVSDAPVILEATGGSYSEYCRISVHTGLPTVLGWGGHELQWRGNYDEPARREPDIATIYQTPDQRQALTLLKRYGIKYVYVGGLEREKYKMTSPSLRKFDAIMDLVYDRGGVRIYRSRS